MTVCVLTIRDGRDDVHERSIASLHLYLPEPDHHVVIDDSEHELGFAGAIAAGWGKVRAAGCEFVFHHEADFLFNAPVPITEMIELLKRKPHLTQVALKRQPVNEIETAAGGVVEAKPGQFHQHHEAGYVYTENRVCWTTNPSVYPVALTALGWPQVEHSEGIFSHRLFDEDPEAASCFWGAKFDSPLCEHIGERVGRGY